MVESEIVLYYYKQKTNFQSCGEIERSYEFEVDGDTDGKLKKTKPY